ncbi:MAG: hypothetical protein FJ290_09550 [Planctomycetes bacterium]|nr:hypothetical protein [Planctomycetota bacterium]
MRPVAIIIGLLSAAAVCSFAFFNDFIMRQTFLVGNYMPISVYGGLLLFLLFVNPLLLRASKRLALTGRELAVIIALTLAACYVPGRGLMHYFGTFLMLPHKYERTTPGWKEAGVMELVPRQMLADISRDESTALNGFVQGMGSGGQSVSFWDVPWSAWARTLAFWLPLLGAFSVAMIALALVVHRQWSSHEQMPYPIVSFANALLPKEGEARGWVFQNRLFWIGCTAILAIHLNNYAVVWWPRYLIRVERTFDFQSLIEYIPAFQRVRGEYMYNLMNPTLYFAVIAFAFFLSTDVSFSLGIAGYVYAWVAGTLAGYGVTLGGGGFLSLKVETFLFGGAYFGMFLVLVYTGRHYYLNVFRRGLGLRSAEEVEKESVWAARVFLACSALFALQLWLVGLDWYLALLYTAGAVIIFTVVSRLVAETGAFYLHAYHFPCVILWGLLGSKALGPKAMLIMFMVTSLLLIDPREAVMPFTVQAFKLVDSNRVKLGRVAVWSVVAILVAFAVAVPVTLYCHYNEGVGKTTDDWTKNVPKMAFDATVSAMEKLKAQGNLEEAGQHSGWAWFQSLAPNRDCVLAFAIALGLTLGFAAARLRFPRWPFHPIMFLVLATWQSRCFAFSFLIGCLIKVAVTKYGGASAYQRLKPLMIGVIAGDMLGGLLPMIIGAVSYLVWGEPPKRFMVFPS